MQTVYTMKNGRVIKRQSLPVVDCSNCGACCMHMGTPPGYAAYYPVHGEIADWAKESPDYQRWLDLPKEVEAELREYYRAVQAGELDDRTREYVDAAGAVEAIKKGRLHVAEQLIRNVKTSQQIPCLWYDAGTRRCRHYEHRPEVCRDAIAPGDEACLSTRKANRIPLP